MFNQKTLCLIIVMCIFSLCSNAQKDTIPRKTNTIKVTGVTFDEAVNKLLDKGYLLEKTDKDYQIVQTKIKTVKSVMISLAVRIKNDTAIITGLANPNTEVNISGVIIKSDDTQISNKGARGSLLRKAWLEMNEFALSFNKPVEYLIK